MAKRLQEQFFNVGQAPNVATEAQDFQGLKLAEALSGLLQDSFSAANTFTSIYASEKKQQLSEARRAESEARRQEAEARRKKAEDQQKRNDEIAYEVAQDFNQLGSEEFLKKYETMSVVDENFEPDFKKQAIINEQVALINFGKFQKEFNTEAKAYQQTVLSNPELTYNQNEVDVIGQNLLEKYLRQGGNNPFYMTSFYPKAVNHLSTTVQGQRVSKSQKSFEKHTNNLVNGIYATVNYMPPITPGSEAFTQAASVFGYDPNTTNEQETEVIQLYHRSKTLINQVDQARRQQKIITGEADDGSIMKNLFDNLAVNGEIDLMEAVLNLPMKDMGVLYKDAPGYGDDLYKKYVEAKQKQNTLQDSEAVRNANKILVEDAEQVGSLISSLQTGGAEDYQQNLSTLNQAVESSLEAVTEQIRLIRNTGNEGLTRSLVDYKTYLEEVQSGKHSHSSTDNFKIVKELNRRRIDGEPYRNYLLNNMSKLTLETFQEYNSFDRKNLNDEASRSIVTEFGRMLPGVTGADLDEISREIANLSFQDPGNPVIQAFNEAKEYITEILPSQYSFYYGTDVSTRQAIKKDPYLNDILTFAQEAASKPNTEIPLFEEALDIDVPAFMNMSPEEQVKEFYSSIKVGELATADLQSDETKYKYSPDERRFLYRLVTEGDPSKALRFKEALLQDRSPSPSTKRRIEKKQAEIDEEKKLEAARFIVEGDKKVSDEEIIQKQIAKTNRKIPSSEELFKRFQQEFKDSKFLQTLISLQDFEKITPTNFVDVILGSLGKENLETISGRQLTEKERQQLLDEFGYEVSPSGTVYKRITGESQ